jgi:hypothetical protein
MSEEDTQTLTRAYLKDCCWPLVYKGVVCTRVQIESQMGTTSSYVYYLPGKPNRILHIISESPALG